MTINRIFTQVNAPHQPCPDCGSAEDIIPWGKGWMCRDCGYEWDCPQTER
ncbi:hypothetical protein ABN225_13210 [Providencia alcalifaciens]